MSLRLITNGLSLIAVAFIMLSASACNDETAAIPEINFRVEIHDVPSPSLEADTNQIRVYLPKGQAGEKSALPVVFFLHGWGSDAAAFERLSGVETLRRLNISDLGIISINGGTSGYANWADGVNKWEAHVIEDVSDYLSRNFYQFENLNTIAVYGVSMGGEAALRLGMKYRGKVSCAAAHSAAISTPDFEALPEWQKQGFRDMDDFNQRYGDPFDPGFWQQANARFFAQELPQAELRKTEYYFDVGRDDQLGFDSSNSDLSHILSERDIPHTFSLKDGRHGADFVTANMSDALTFLTACIHRQNMKLAEIQD